MSENRTSFEMTEADLAEIVDACKPVPYLIIGGMEPTSPQENANRAWARLGEKMGFDSMTVEPVRGKGDRFFTAIPTTAKIEEKPCADIIPAQVGASVLSSSPFERLHPKMFMDGDQWCALYGENLQDGVCGFGDTPEKAEQEFNRAWGAHK